MTTDATASLDEIDTAVANVTPRLTLTSSQNPAQDWTVQSKRRGT
jgi:hypothetical protein